jgi:eukaryotic translation initiation factor 2C
VCSIDSHVSKYHTYVRAQGYRVEIVEAMEEMMREALANFQKVNDGIVPERVIVFRDGVSNGQFAEVKTCELAKIHNALNACNIKATVTFITVQKRHHYRYTKTKPACSHRVTEMQTDLVTANPAP